MPAGRPQSEPEPSFSLKRRSVVGSVTLERVRRWRFPVYEMTVEGQVVARLGRISWWRLFMGRGQSIELTGGTAWRLRAVGMAGAICPVIVDADMRKIALASPHRGGYGLNGPDWAQVLYPSEKRGLMRSNQWILREHETDVAVATRSPRTLTATSTVPLAAAILSLTLVSYSIPGESKLGVPAFRWVTP